jgi:hypothetical protein
MKLKVWQIVLAVVLGIAGIGVVLQAAGLAPKPGGKPTGAMYMGGIVAMDMANAGGVRPSSDRVQALAREAATKSNVADNDRSRFVRDFEFGFWQGWKTANR